MNWFRFICFIFSSKKEVHGKILSYDEMMNFIEKKRKFRFF